jgi:penicillin amidase
MPGEDSSYRWQDFIPQEQNPHVINPPEGFIQSANQRPVDSAYPYFIPGNYITARGITIANQLQQMGGITPQDMMRLQSNTYSSFAADAVPLLLRYTNAATLSGKEQQYLDQVKSWNFYADADATAPTIFQAWMDTLEKAIWSDEFARIKGPSPFPEEQTLLEMLLKDSAAKYVDNINTSTVETLQQQVTEAFKTAAANLATEEKENGLTWWKHKNPSVYHLLKTILPFARTGLPVGGWNNTVNALTHSHGPSWRMIVQLTTPTEAYGVYPGGQSGNPGSRYYDDFINTWAAGKYFRLWMMKEEERGDKRIKWTMTFTNS